jgi:hypothetical protein
MFHQLAGRAYATNFQLDFTYLEPLPDRQLIHFESFGRNVLPDNSRRKLQRPQCFDVHQQHLPLSAGSRVRTPFESGIFNHPQGRQLFHRCAPLRRAKQDPSLLPPGFAARVAQYRAGSAFLQS